MDAARGVEPTPRAASFLGRRGGRRAAPDGRFSILARALLPGPSRPAAILRAWDEAPTRGLRDALLAGASSLARSPLG